MYTQHIGTKDRIKENGYSVYFLDRVIISTYEPSQDGYKLSVGHAEADRYTLTYRETFYDLG